jgi:hypothetical protein
MEKKKRGRKPKVKIEETIALKAEVQALDGDGVRAGSGPPSKTVGTDDQLATTKIANTAPASTQAPDAAPLPFEIPPPINAGEAIARARYKEEGAKRIKDVTVPDTSDLSLQAKKWDAYLKMQQISPEKFLEKYTYHPSRQFIQEIIDKRK